MGSMITNFLVKLYSKQVVNNTFVCRPWGGTQDEVLLVLMAIDNPRHVTQIYRLLCHLTTQVATANLTRTCPRFETRRPY